VDNSTDNLKTNTPDNSDYAWLEVSLVCSGEIAEAISELFSRYAPDGVVLHNITSFDTADYEEVPTGDMRVAAYLANDENLESTLYKLEESLFYMRQIVPFDELEKAWVENQDWMAAWKQHYHPLPIGKDLMILPAWVDPRVAGERTPIIISPDMAFGTGTHPSTQLCMVALEQYGCERKNVIDIGCGSGILAIQAIRQGAAAVLGVDNDPDAIPSCVRNAALNGMEEGRIIFEVGTHTDILAREDGLYQAPVVLANILAPILTQMLNSGLAYIVSPDGIIIMGGILDTQAPDLIAVAETQGLHHIETLQDGDWVVLVFKRS